MNSFFLLNMLHIFNDGYEASFLLLLPFIAKDLHINLAQVGMLGTANNLVELLVAIPAALLARRIGGLQTITLALLIYCVGYIATGFAPSLLLLFITFAIAGIGFGSFHSIAFALIAHWTDPKKRGLHIGNFTAIGDIGRIAISTLLTFVIGFIGWRHGSFLYASIGIFAFIFFFFFTFKKNDAVNVNKKAPIHVSFMEILSHKPFLLANLVNFADTFASNSLFIFLPFLLLHRGINPSILGAFTAVFFVGNFLGKTILGRFSDKFGNEKTFIISEILMAIMIVILANITSFIVIIGSSLMLGIFTKGTVPVIKTMVSDAAQHHGNFEKAFSLNSIIATTAVTLAPLTLGFISNQFGIVSAFNFSAVCAIIATIPAFLYQRENKSVTPEALIHQR